jgi:hypothetical protein
LPTLVPFWSLFSILMTRVESPSTMVFVILSQLRISCPSSRAPNFAELLVEFPMLPMYSRMMLFPLSLITPPAPATFGFPFVASSKFSLRNPNGGGVQLRAPVSSCGLRSTVRLLHRFFSWKRSRIRESWSVSCAFSILQLRLCIVSLI